MEGLGTDPHPLHVRLRDLRQDHQDGGRNALRMGGSSTPPTPREVILLSSSPPPPSLFSPPSPPHTGGTRGEVSAASPDMARGNLLAVRGL